MARLVSLKKKLNEILLENKLLSEKDLKKALQIQKENRQCTENSLVEEQRRDRIIETADDGHQREITWEMSNQENKRCQKTRIKPSKPS